MISLPQSQARICRVCGHKWNKRLGKPEAKRCPKPECRSLRWKEISYTVPSDLLERIGPDALEKRISVEQWITDALTDSLRMKTSVAERIGASSVTDATGNRETAEKIAARLPEIQEARDREWWLRRIAEIMKIGKTDKPEAIRELKRLSGGVEIPKGMYRSPEVLAEWLAENALAPAEMALGPLILPPE